MVVNMESQGKFDALLWGLALAVVAAAIGGNYYFAEASALMRVGGILASGLLAVGLIWRTSSGRKFLSFWQDAVVELRKVVWPTRKETLQSTMAVVTMVFIMGLVLWSIDSVLVKLVGWIIKGAV